MGEASRTSEARMRAAVVDTVATLDRHGHGLNRVEGIAVVGAVLATYALLWAARRRS